MPRRRDSTAAISGHDRRSSQRTGDAGVGEQPGEHGADGDELHQRAHARRRRSSREMPSRCHEAMPTATSTSRPETATAPQLGIVGHACSLVVSRPARGGAARAAGAVRARVVRRGARGRRRAGCVSSCSRSSEVDRAAGGDAAVVQHAHVVGDARPARRDVVAHEHDREPVGRRARGSPRRRRRPQRGSSAEVGSSSSSTSGPTARARARQSRCSSPPRQARRRPAEQLVRVEGDPARAARRRRRRRGRGRPRAPRRATSSVSGDGALRHEHRAAAQLAHVEVADVGAAEQHPARRRARRAG